MGKIILALVMMASLADAGPLRTYDVHATVSAWTDLPSCGASERMLQDSHRIVWREDWSVWVNGLEWNVIPSDEPGVLLISFHDGHGQLTTLTMELMVGDRQIIGAYTLYGVLNRTKDGWTECADRVEIRGHRL